MSLCVEQATTSMHVETHRRPMNVMRRHCKQRKSPKRTHINRACQRCHQHFLIVGVWQPLLDEAQRKKVHEKRDSLCRHRRKKSVVQFGYLCQRREAQLAWKLKQFGLGFARSSTSATLLLGRCAALSQSSQQVKRVEQPQRCCCTHTASDGVREGVGIVGHVDLFKQSRGMRLIPQRVKRLLHRVCCRLSDNNPSPFQQVDISHTSQQHIIHNSRHH